MSEPVSRCPTRPRSATISHLQILLRGMASDPLMETNVHLSKNVDSPLKSLGGKPLADDPWLPSKLPSTRPYSLPTMNRLYWQQYREWLQLAQAYSPDHFNAATVVMNRIQSPGSEHQLEIAVAMRLLINCFPSACSITLRASSFFPDGYQFDAIFYGEETHFIIALVTPKLVSYYYNGGELTGGIALYYDSHPKDAKFKLNNPADFEQRLPQLFASMIACGDRADKIRNSAIPTATSKQTSNTTQPNPPWLPKSLQGIKSKNDEATPQVFSPFIVAPIIDFSYEAKQRPEKTRRQNHATLPVTETSRFLPDLLPNLPKRHHAEGLLANEVSPAPTAKPSKRSAETGKEPEPLNTDSRLAELLLEQAKSQKPPEAVSKAKKSEKEPSGRKSEGFFSSFYKNIRHHFQGPSAASASSQMSTSTVASAIEANVREENLEFPKNASLTLQNLNEGSSEVYPVAVKSPKRFHETTTSAPESKRRAHSEPDALPDGAPTTADTTKVVNISNNIKEETRATLPSKRDETIQAIKPHLRASMAKMNAGVGAENQKSSLFRTDVKGSDAFKMNLPATTIAIPLPMPGKVDAMSTNADANQWTLQVNIINPAVPAKAPPVIIQSQPKQVPGAAVTERPVSAATHVQAKNPAQDALKKPNQTPTGTKDGLSPLKSRAPSEKQTSTKRVASTSSSGASVTVGVNIELRVNATNTTAAPKPTVATPKPTAAAPKPTVKNQNIPKSKNPVATTARPVPMEDFPPSFLFPGVPMPAVAAAVSRKALDDEVEARATALAQDNAKGLYARCQERYARAGRPEKFVPDVNKLLLQPYLGDKNIGKFLLNEGAKLYAQALKESMTTTTANTDEMASKMEHSQGPK